MSQIVISTVGRKYYVSMRGALPPHFFLSQVLQPRVIRLLHEYELPHLAEETAHLLDNEGYCVPASPFG